jgi:hypothetical protein
MKWIKWIVSYLFDCVHRHTTWPHQDGRGLDYVCCLDCGKELPYSTQRMSIVTKEEQLADYTCGWEDIGSDDSGVMDGFSRESIRAS